MLLSQLGISNGCNVVFDSTEYHPEEIVTTSIETYDSSSLSQFVDPTWATTTVCPFFNEFSFTYDESENQLSSQTLPDIEVEEEDDTDFEEYTSSFEMLSQRGQEFESRSEFFSPPSPSPSPYEGTSFMPEDSPEDILASQIDHMSLDTMSSQYSEYPDDFDHEPSDNAISQLLDGTPNIPSVDFVKNLVNDSNDYDYFNNSLLSNWAGPEHWKFKVTKNKRKYIIIIMS